MWASLSLGCPKIGYVSTLNELYETLFTSEMPGDWVCLHVKKLYEALFELDVAINCGMSPYLRERLYHPHLVHLRRLRY